MTIEQAHRRCQGPPRPGHRRRRRRRVRRPPARDPERAGDHQHRPADRQAVPPGARSGPAPGREHRARHRHGHHRRPGARPGSASTPAPPIPCRSARPRSGRIMNVIGEPIDEAGPIATNIPPPDPPRGPDLRRTGGLGRNPGHRHQGDRPALPLHQGRQDRPVRRRRRRQDRDHAGADQQHRQGLWRLFGAGRRGRAHPRRQRPLSRDDRVQRECRPQEGGLGRGLQMRPGLWPDERAAGRPRPRGADRPFAWRNISATRKARTCCCSSTTSSASPRPVRKCRRCWAVFPARWAISRRWPPRWAICRSASPRPTRARSPRCRRSTCPPTT